MRRVSHLCRWVAMMAAVVLLVSCLPICLPAEAASTAASIEAIGKGGIALSVVEYNGAKGLYLPGYIDRKAVTLRYTGSTGLFCSTTNSYIGPGQTGVFNLSAPSVMFYEKSPTGGSDIAFTVRVMGGSDSVPSLYISLDSNTSLSWLHEDKDNKGAGSMTMLSGSGAEVYNGTLDTIKCRGTTSFTQPGLAPGKKSYAIKLTDKAELIEGAGKMKKWALIHMRVCDTFMKEGVECYDWTGLSNLLGYQTYAALAGDGYANIKAQYVDVYIDGAYMGAFILTERVDVNASVDISDPEEYVSSSSPDDHRIYSGGDDPAIQAGIQYFQYTADAVKKQDFDITGGYLLEVNTDVLEEPCGFQTERGMLIDIKAPEVCTREQVSYIARYFQLFEDALYSETGYNDEGKHYSEYVDMDSLASLMITCAFMKNWELFRTSTYMYIDTADSDHPKLTFGPAWDFETGVYMFEYDSTFYSKHQLYVDTHSQCYNIIGQLTTKGDFQQKMYEKQKELQKIINATLGSGKYAGITPVNTLWTDALDSLEMNWMRWGFESILDGKGGPFAGHDNTYEYYAQKYVNAFMTRCYNWENLWDPNEYLLALTVESQFSSLGGYTLTAQTQGVVEGYQWYRLTENNELEEIPNATSKRYIVKETGIYYCIVQGNNQTYYGGALNDVLNSNTLFLTSQPVYVDVTNTSTTPGNNVPVVITKPSFVGGSTTTTGTTGGTDSTTAQTGSTTDTTDPAMPTTTTGAAESTGTTTVPTQSGETSQSEQQAKPKWQMDPTLQLVLLIACAVLCFALLWWGDGYTTVYLLYRQINTR